MKVLYFGFVFKLVFIEVLGFIYSYLNLLVYLYQGLGMFIVVSDGLCMDMLYI